MILPHDEQLAEQVQHRRAGPQAGQGGVQGLRQGECQHEALPGHMMVEGHMMVNQIGKRGFDMQWTWRAGEMT
jgi:hypothetical protein